MTYIPNVRHKIDKAWGKERLNYYWQGYLDDDGVAELRTYDFAMSCLECALENEADDMEDDLCEHTMKVIREHAENVYYSMELTRNELVVSCIDCLSEEEAEAIRKAVDSGERKNCYTVEEVEDDTTDNEC